MSDSAVLIVMLINGVGVAILFGVYLILGWTTWLGTGICMLAVGCTGIGLGFTIFEDVWLLFISTIVIDGYKSNWWDF
jgi:hypothetical protein